MEVTYLYCGECGYESTKEQTVVYSRTTASGDSCLCPNCKKETFLFETGEGNE